MAGPGGFNNPNPQGSGQSRRDDALRISIGVDARTNTLVVAAADPLFDEVKQLVEQLDVAAASQNETVRVVTLHRTSAAAVEKALAAFAGDAVQTNNPTPTAPPPLPTTTRSPPRPHGGPTAVTAARPADCPAGTDDGRRAARQQCRAFPGLWRSSQPGVWRPADAQLPAGRSRAIGFRSGMTSRFVGWDK